MIRLALGSLAINATAVGGFLMLSEKLAS